VGSLGHMMGESFQFDAKVIMTHIPYRGAGPALNDAPQEAPAASTPIDQL